MDFIKSKKFILGTVSIVLILVIVALGVWRYTYLNGKNPTPYKEAHGMNEYAVLGNFAIKADKFEMLTLEESKAIMSEQTFKVVSSTKGDARILLITTTVRNISEIEDKLSESSRFAVRSRAYAQGAIYVPIFFELNMGKQYNLKLKPGEEETIVIPCCIFSVSFSDKEWSCIDSRQFELSLSLNVVSKYIVLS